MEIDEKPTEDYSMVGGLDKQIEELIEAVVLPITHRERFRALGIKPPKGVLLFGPPGTGKTLLARACAAKTEATFLKLSAPQLVQMYIGDGAKMVRDAFALAREKAPTIIFLDELDAIGTKRFDSDKSGDREVQRTMLELLNQLDGFSRCAAWYCHGVGVSVCLCSDRTKDWMRVEDFNKYRFVGLSVGSCVHVLCGSCHRACVQ